MNQNNTIGLLLQDKGGNYIFPFLWMHGESEEVLRKYMQVIYEGNMRTVPSVPDLSAGGI